MPIITCEASQFYWLSCMRLGFHFLAVFFLFGCRSELQLTPSQKVVDSAPRLITKDIPVLKICNFKDGHFTLNGKASSLPTLKTALSNCRERQGVAWFYAESYMEGEQVPQIYKDVGNAFAEEVVKKGLDARISGSSNFADVIEEQNNLRKLIDSQLSR